MSSQYIRWPVGSGGGVPTYANATALPATATDGSLAVTLDTDKLYVFDGNTVTWLVIGGAGVPLAIGTIDSQTASANGAVLASNSLVLQSASDTRPGLINNSAQTLTGVKSFTNNINANSAIDRSSSGALSFGTTNTTSINLLNSAIFMSPNQPVQWWGSDNYVLMVNSTTWPLDRVNNGFIVGSSDVVTDVKTIDLGFQTGANLANASTAVTGNLWLSTGANLSGTGDTGDITLQTGDVDGGGTRGGIILNVGGYVTPTKNTITLRSPNLTITSSTNISAGSNKIHNVTDPTSAQDAATMNYVDSNFPNVTLAAVGSSPNANAASISSQVLNLQPADATNPGVVTTGTQSFAGAKTFTGAISASNLSGTNTGNVTVGAIGSSPNANGLTLSSQALNLEPASASFGGVLTSGAQSIAGAKTFTGAISATNLSGSNTGDITLGAFGSTPSSTGASLSSQVLTLQPADGTNPGGVSTTTQTFAGAKTFTGNVAMASNGLTVGTNQLVVSGGFLGLQQASPTVALHLGNTGNLARGGIVLPSASTINFAGTPGSNADYSLYALYGDTSSTAVGAPAAGTINFRIANSMKASMSATGAWSALTYTATQTTNQLILGTTNTTTITSTAPAASRVYTIADAGGADTFTMNAASQALTNKTIAAGSNTITGLTVPMGGTGVASATAYAVLCGGTTSTAALQSVSGVGSSGHVLTSNGASALPTWQATASAPTRVSSVLTTRVTATPANAGEYRCLIQNASAATSADNAPGAAPSSTNGMRIYSVGYATAGTSGQTNKWCIYVGTNKTAGFQFYTTTGFTGQINTSYYQAFNTSAYGVKTSYDPTTGVAIVSCIPDNGDMLAAYCGWAITPDGSASTRPTDVYFDILYF